MKFQKIIALAVVLAASALTARAGDGFSVFAAPGTALNAGTNYVVFPSQTSVGGSAGAAPLVTYISYNSLAASAITMTAYVSTNSTQEVLTNSTTTLTVNATNGFVAGQIVLIQHLVSGALARYQYEAAFVSSVANTNQIVLVTAPVQPVLPGDIVYQETSTGTIPCATSTSAQSINGTGITVGERRKPFMLVISSTALGTNTINTACATYTP